MFNFAQKNNNNSANDSRTPTKAGALEQNSRNDELKLAVSSTGQTLSDYSDQNDPNTTQLAKAMGIYGRGAQTMQDNGTANTVQLTPVTGTNGLQLPLSTDGGYNRFNGAIISFIPAAANTGNVTISIGQTTVAQLGAKKALNVDGSELSPDTLSTSSFSNFVYFSSADSGSGAFILSSRTGSFVPDASETVKGIAEILTQEEADSGTDDSRILTIAKLLGRPGTVLQQKFITNTTIVSTTSTSYVSSGISFSLDNDLLSITNNIRIRIFGSGSLDNNNFAQFFTLHDGTSLLNGSLNSLGGLAADVASGVYPWHIAFENTPGSLTPKTYTIYHKVNGDTGFINRGGEAGETCQTVIIIEEISA